MNLFDPIAHIMSYRCFLLFADDGEVQLGDPVTQPAPDFDPFSDTGPMYAHEVLMAECERASARSLTNIVLPFLRSKECHGIFLGGRSCRALPRPWRYLASPCSCFYQLRMGVVSPGGRRTTRTGGSKQHE